MPVERIPLPFTSYQTRARRSGVQRLVNCHPEKGQQKGEITLYGDPGIATKLTLATSAQRGAIEFQKELHVVSGTSLYRVSSDGTQKRLGTIPGGGHVVMAENGAQLGILADFSLYVWNGSTVSKVTDTNFRAAVDMVFIDNYILLIEHQSGRFFGSDLGDMTSYDALNFATAESYPDDLIGVSADHGQAFLAGRRSCELWDNVGGSGFPFAKNFNGTIEQGCGAAQSIVKADQTLFWIDDVGMARRLDGVTPVRVSQHGVEQAWSEYSTLEDAIGYSYICDGHIYVLWTFPTAKRTWVYDVTTKQWNEKESYGRTRWRAHWAMNIYGGVWVGDEDTGKIGAIDPKIGTEFDDRLVMSWTYPSVYAEKKLAFHRELEVILEGGVGTDEPEIMMEVSDDGGRTFEFLPDRMFGKVGNYRDKVTWTELGSSEDRVYRGAISSPVQRAVHSTFLNWEQGVF